MTGMTLKKFLYTMTNFDEIEFSYKGVQYDFQKERDAAQVKISVWQGGKNPKCCYCIEVEDSLAEFETVAKNLIHAKILFDGKSVAEAEQFIDVEFFS